MYLGIECMRQIFESKEVCFDLSRKDFSSDLIKSFNMYELCNFVWYYLDLELSLEKFHDCDVLVDILTQAFDIVEVDHRSSYSLNRLLSTHRSIEIKVISLLSECSEERMENKVILIRLLVLYRKIAYLFLQLVIIHPHQLIQVFRGQCLDHVFDFLDQLLTSRFSCIINYDLEISDEVDMLLSQWFDFFLQCSLHSSLFSAVKAQLVKHQLVENMTSKYLLLPEFATVTNSIKTRLMTAHYFAKVFVTYFVWNEEEHRLSFQQMSATTSSSLLRFCLEFLVGYFSQICSNGFLSQSCYLESLRIVVDILESIKYSFEGEFSIPLQKRVDSAVEMSLAVLNMSMSPIFDCDQSIAKLPHSLMFVVKSLAVEALFHLSGSQRMPFSSNFLPECSIPFDLLVDCGKIHPTLQFILQFDADRDSWKDQPLTSQQSVKLRQFECQIESDKQRLITEREVKLEAMCVDLSQSDAWRSQSISSVLWSSCADNFSIAVVVNNESKNLNVESLYAFYLLCGVNSPECSQLHGLREIIADNLIMIVKEESLALLSSNCDLEICQKILVSCRLYLLMIGECEMDIKSTFSVAFQSCINVLMFPCSHHRVGFLSDLYVPLLQWIEALTRVDSVSRRQFVKYLGKLFRRVQRWNPAAVLPILLQCVENSLEFIFRLDEEGEEALVTLILKTIRLFHYPRIQVCGIRLIAELSSSHPGLLHRGLSRLETEDILVSLLQREKNDSYLFYVIKACVACLKDVNLKPRWVYRPPYLYPFQAYQGGICRRPLLQTSILPIFLSKFDLSEGLSMMPMFSQFMAMATMLMYDCMDGIISPPHHYNPANSNGTHCKDGNKASGNGMSGSGGGGFQDIHYYGGNLRDDLLSHTLPFLARSLDILTRPEAKSSSSLVSSSSSKNKKLLSASPNTCGNTQPTSPKRNLLVSSARAFLKGASHSLRVIGRSRKAKASLESNQPLDGIIAEENVTNTNEKDISVAGEGFGKSVEERPMIAESPPPSLHKSWTRQIDYSKIKNGNDNNINVAEQSLTERYNAVMKSSNTNKPNLALEMLAEKTIDAVFAFLCLEEMFPLSSYLRNIAIFNRSPVIASVASIMSRFPENEVISKRGLEVFRCFAMNQTEVSSLAMHAPPVMVSLMTHTSLGKEVECQNLYCAILAILGQADDFARENVIRFGVDAPLWSIIQGGGSGGSSAEIAVQACLAISALCQTVENATLLCREYHFIDGILQFLARKPNEKRVQVEGFKAIVALALCEEEALTVFHNPDNVLQYKKTKKYIKELCRSDRGLPEYSRSYLEKLLSSYRGPHDDGCQIA